MTGQRQSVTIQGDPSASGIQHHQSAPDLGTGVARGAPDQCARTRASSSSM